MAIEEERKMRARGLAALAALVTLRLALAPSSLGDGQVLETFPFEDRRGQEKAYRDAQTFDRQSRSRGLATHIAGPVYDGKEGGPGRYEVHTNARLPGRAPFVPGPVALDGEILRVFPFEARTTQGKANQGAKTFEIEVRKYKVFTHIAGPLYDGKEAGPGRYEVRLTGAKTPRDYALALPWAAPECVLPKGLQEAPAGPKRHVGHSPFRNLGWQIHAYFQALELVKMLEARDRRACIAGPFPSRHPGAGWWDVYEDLSRRPEEAPDEPAPEPEKPAEPQPEAKPEAGALPEQVYVTVARVNLFEKPQAGSGTAGTAAKGAALSVWAEDGAWYFVSLPDGTTGWVPKAFTTPTAPQP